MSEMVERVRLAISAGATTEQARAAIEAMREPTEAMIAAGGTDSKWRVGEITAYASETGDLHAAFANDVWSAMVDAALKD